MVYAPYATDSLLATFLAQRSLTITPFIFPVFVYWQAVIASCDQASRLDCLDIAPSTSGTGDAHGSCNFHELSTSGSVAYWKIQCHYNFLVSLSSTFAL